MSAVHDAVTIDVPETMTVLDAIKKETEFLERKGIDSPRLQVELLLAHVLNLPRLRLYLDFERKLTEEQSGVVRLHHDELDEHLRHFARCAEKPVF